MDKSLKTIATFSYAPEMGLVRSKLESEGIECFVKDELTSQTYIHNAVGGMKLQVKAEDAERARKLIEEMGVFNSSSEKGPGMKQFDRLSRKMPLLGKATFVVRFFALLVLIAVALVLIYMLAVL